MPHNPQLGKVMTTFNLTYSAETNKASLLALLATKGTVLFSLDSLRVVGIETAETKQTIEGLSGVVLVEEDTAVTIAPHTATWHLQRLVTESLPLKTGYTTRNLGENVVVYLIDSGVDSTHSELSEATIINLHSYNSDFSDTVGHGTSLASLINGKTVGVSSGAIVKSVKIPFGSSTLSVLLTAFDAVLADHSASAGVKVVNCSWTIPKSQLLDGKITELQSAGLVVVAAAGNSGVAADTLSPVGLNSVIGVGASDAYDRVIAWALGSSSNWGPEVDVAAPGVDVMSADIAGGLAEKSGTSVAAAVVSGAICQYIKQNSASTASQIQTLFLDGANDDMLFRNETIYGTTPNKIARACGYDVRNLMVGVSQNTMFAVERGILTTIDITALYPAMTVSHVDYTISRNEWATVYKALPWVTVTTEGGVTHVSVTPPGNINAGKYIVRLTFTEDGKTFIGQIVMGVFIDSDSELNAIVDEKYLSVDESDNLVYIVAAYCNDSGDCSKGQECCNNECSFLAC